MQYQPGFRARSVYLLSICGGLPGAAALATALLAGLVAPGPICLARTLWVEAGSQVEAEDGSPGKPFHTISGALQVAAAGDTVVVRQGVYRESLRIPSGEPGTPFTLRAQEGQRVVVTACQPVEGWQDSGEGLWTAAIDFLPDALYQSRRPLPVARTPNEGWWQAAAAEGARLIDAEHLNSGDVGGPLGQARVWVSHGNYFATLPIAGLDPAQGVLLLELGRNPPMLSAADRYCLENRRQWIDRPGEWAVEPEGSRYRLWLSPLEGGKPHDIEARPSQGGSLINVRNAQSVRLEGLEVCGSPRMGIEVQGGRDISVRRCIVHHCASDGISLRDVRDSTATENIVWHNGSGISVSFAQGVVVERNDVGYNLVDGILVTWQSSDVTVRRNYVHHHLLYGHPDNMQVYRGVTNVRFLENLLLAGGQSLMMEETTQGEFAGNMLAGSGAVMLIFGHGNAGQWRIHRNTLAFAGYGCMNLTWKDYEVNENVFMTGTAGPVYGVRGVEGYRADRNLFWNTARAQEPTIMATEAGWLRSWDAVRASTGQDAHSVYAEPQFRSGPIGYAVFDDAHLLESTRASWYLRSRSAQVRPGDIVEVNFDGRARRVLAVEQVAAERGTIQKINVAPPLAEKPMKDWLVAVWGPVRREGTDGQLVLDLRLADDSPGVRLSSTGGPVGSTIDIPSYQRGDFDGDGQRDLPERPADLLPAAW